MYDALHAVAEAIFATEAGPPPPERTEWVARDVIDILDRGGQKSRLLFRLSLFAVGLVAPLFLLSFRPLRSLPLPRRIEALDRLERSQLALPLLAVKALLCLVYYEHPDAQREVGFDGACLVPAKALARSGS